ncbi:hypothetical protein B5P44_00665 [Mycobacterium sp. CBMA 213]|nr:MULTISPECIES: hypothetical protein [unclassified Mycolicibacterium]MUL61098.1 hypothetical protein [Mycolicibacterium sp. CBMA 335]MUM03335.1 hypothetical protein [Mycolicibacterium sp. CBMA 213]
MAMSPYALQTKWYEPWLTVDHVATILSVKPQTIRQYLAGTGAEPFPQPQAKADGRNQWSSASIYDFILGNRPQYLSRVPRLYPRIVDPPPAQFLGSEIMQIDHLHRAALHYWQPGDGHGPIIVAYVSPSTSSAEAQWFSEKIAAERRVSSVIVPENAITRLGGSGVPNGVNTPAVAVTDTATDAPSLGEHVDEVVNMYTWRELANLLRTDVPYWPPGLDDLAAIDAWRPGSPVRVVRPCIGEMSSQSLRAALSVGTARNPQPTSTGLSTAIENACRAIDYRVSVDRGLLPGTGGLVYPHIPDQLGLKRAAVSVVTDSDPVTVADADVLALLHAPAALEHAHHGVLIGGVTGLWPAVMSDCQIIDRDSPGPLYRRWRDRLTPVTDLGQRRVLGFLMLPSLGLQDDPSAEYFHDPERAHCWIVETSTHVYIAQRRSLPEARGRLQRVEIRDDPHQEPAIFVEDEGGMVWLLPHFTAAGSLRVGRDGAGPRRLARLLTDLLDDVSATPSDDPPYHWVDGVEEPNALRDFLISTSAPIGLSRADLLALLDDPEAVSEVLIGPCATCGFEVPTPLAELPHSFVGLDAGSDPPCVLVSARGHFNDVCDVPGQEFAALMTDAHATACNLLQLPDIEHININIGGRETHMRVSLEPVGSWRPKASPDALRGLAEQLRRPVLDGRGVAEDQAFVDDISQFNDEDFGTK